MPTSPEGRGGRPWCWCWGLVPFPHQLWPWSPCLSGLGNRVEAVGAPATGQATWAHLHGSLATRAPGDSQPHLIEATRRRSQGFFGTLLSLLI